VARYLISFDRGWMSIPEEDLHDVGEAARGVVKETHDAGVFVFAGGSATRSRRRSSASTGRSPTDRIRRPRR
jgi:hypothetical protein